MQEPHGRTVSDDSRSAFDALAGAIERAVADGVCDSAALRRAVAECAREARRDAQPPQRFLVRVKQHARVATVRAGPVDADSITRSIVRWAVDAYYAPS